MLSVCLYIPYMQFRMPDSIFMQLGMYIMAPEPISTAYFINPSHEFLYMWNSVKRCRGNEYTFNKTIVGSVVFYAVRVVSMESRRLVLPATYCLYSHLVQLIVEADTVGGGDTIIAMKPQLLQQINSFRLC
jgi:hypothetical protein